MSHRENEDSAGSGSGQTPVAHRHSVITEDGVALAFVTKYGDRVRFDHATRKWLLWDGEGCTRDQLGRVIGWIRLLCRDHAALAPKQARSLRRASTIHNIERLARCDQRIAYSHSEGRP